MGNNKEFELITFAQQPTVINTSRIMVNDFNTDILFLLKKKLKTFSLLITDKILKESFDEYFKNEL